MASQTQSVWNTVRINLAEISNQRYSDASILSTNSGLIGVGLIGVMIVGLTTTVTKDVRLINCFPTKVQNPFINPYTDNTASVKKYISKRPGFAVQSTPDTTAGSAIKIWLGQGSGSKVISAFGTANSTIYDGTNSLGTITGLAKDITETFIGTVANLVIPSSNNTAWYYPDGGALTQIVDVDYPGNASLTPTGTFVHLDGYAFIMTTDGRIWNSDLGSITSWVSTSFITAQLSPDRGVGLATYKNKIVAFGKESIEFFENVGNPLGSPLQRIPEVFIKLGSPSQSLITSIEDTLVFVASSSTGSYSIYLLENYQPKKISFPEIDAVISQIGISNFTASSVRLWGKPIFILSSTTRTFVYSLEDQMWCEWNSSAPLWYKLTGDTQEHIYSISNSTLAGVVGKVFVVNQQNPVYQDVGSNYVMSIQTSKLDFGTNKRKRLHRLRIVGDQSSMANTMSVTWSDDDYQTYSSSRTIDLTINDQRTNNMGIFRRRNFLLSNSSSTSTRLEAIEVDISMLNS